MTVTDEREVVSSASVELVLKIEQNGSCGLGIKSVVDQTLPWGPQTLVDHMSKKNQS